MVIFIVLLYLPFANVALDWSGRGVLTRNSTLNTQKTRSAQQRSKVVLHLESSPRIGDYGTSLIEHRRVTLLFGTQPFFTTVLIFFGERPGRLHLE